MASRALVGVAARSVADIGEVTLSQFRALVVLSSRPGMSVSVLAGVLAVHPTTATRLCDRLVAKRLVRRTEGVQDRRATELHLAVRGRRLVDRVTERRARDLAEIAGRMDPRVWAAATAALTAFGEAAGEPAGLDLFGWDTTRT